MISAILLLNNKGEMLISRFYRDNISRSAAEAFRNRVASKDLKSPVVNIEKCSFMFVRVGDVYLTAVTKLNANPGLAFQFLYKLTEVFRVYFSGVIDEDSVRNNFVLIYELLDETMDHGYPQLTATNILTQYIKSQEMKDLEMYDDTPSGSAGGITSEITGAVDWRQPGKYKYRKNEVYIDVLEAVNMLQSNQGVLLEAGVSGKILMRTQLSGMPECKFGTNDKLVLENDAKRHNKRPTAGGITVDDVVLHRCVNLGNYEHDRTISFIPPDGDFELMKYRITQNINLPFSVIPVVSEHGRTRVEYEVKVKSRFDPQNTSGVTLSATGVVLRIPCPPNTAKCNVEVTKGEAKYNANLKCIVWKIRKFKDDKSFFLKGQVKLVASVNEKAWSRPPVTMDFSVPMFAASGMHIRSMKVLEKSGYETIKWVRYMTKAGQYQIRI
mmetsp:Transcript_5356/g.8414  ORF Transcript_5356/g.8414 Transcript_5356/m.8414 type:complete len:440 (+) Transcript_5356:113-1432(+)|eukprot:CAMPEP_0175137568 /NCGR_PEP_ID=MMETSP0087-20121206/9882_1 /TAXON_ID=136419 /ORGANISM="Unknown Unknown, Strain D1" /LENGTH=439 /DNA_ID=CAMNT_0016420407 /DNA_START=117 /DNA_END=1436 /DNA_ORIENTATION=-